MGYDQTITLTAGTYYFTSISTGYIPTLLLDVTDGDINIFVTGSVNLGGENTIKVKNGGGWVTMSIDSMTDEQYR